MLSTAPGLEKLNILPFRAGIIASCLDCRSSFSPLFFVSPDFLAYNLLSSKARKKTPSSIPIIVH